MPVGDRQPVELLQDREAWADEPRRLADEVFGHHAEWDPGTNERWTCSSCGRAVLRVGCNIYGSAVMVGCEFTAVGQAWRAENPGVA
jgi:hypothetical protein